MLEALSGTLEDLLVAELEAGINVSLVPGRELHSTILLRA